MRLMEAKNLDVSFFSGKAERIVHAVNDVSFYLEEGDFLGLVGESGCGKSTIARILSGLIKPDGGQILYDGKEYSYPFSRQIYKTVQMIFQMPRDSFDPRRTIGSCITDIQVNFGVKRDQARKKTVQYLERTGLGREFVKKYPHQMSGGECQRAAIARAIAVQPKILICDEITSALDVSVQAQIVELLQDLKEEMNLSLLFISHDLALVQGLCDRILVMHDGVIVEEGKSGDVLHNPQTDYTKLLISSVLEI